MPHGSDKPEIQSEQKKWCKIRQCDFSSIVGSSYRTPLDYVISLTEQTMMTTQANLWTAFSPSMKYRTPWTVDSYAKY